MTMADTSTVISELVDISTPQGLIDAQWFHPAGEGSWPGVILFTDIRGVRPAFEAIARRLAGHGYAVLLPNVYYRGGRAPVVDPALPMTDEGARAKRSALRAALTPDAVRADVAALLTFLSDNPHVSGQGVGVVGYCMSGSFALRAAADFPERVSAAASFHGGGLASETADSPHLGAASIKARLYFGHADADASASPEIIARLEEALSQAGIRFRSELYAGARHGFAVSDGQAYNVDAAERHWTNLLALFDTELRHGQSPGAAKLGDVQ